jgi:hypothetical protein
MPLSRDDDTAAANIVSTYHERRKQRSGTFKRMQEVRDHYNGDVVVPLPELDESEKPAIPNLIAQGIDSFAMRVASTLPRIVYPSLRPGIKDADNRASRRQHANDGWWAMNRMGTKVRRRARHLTAYGMSVVSLSPVSLDPADKRKIPHWRVRNPLSSYPAPMIDPDNMEPTDCIFADQRPLGWLKANYAKQTSILHRGDKTDTDMFQILEYIDGVETVLIAIGAEKKHGETVFPTIGQGISRHVILERVVNRSEICPVVIAGRITLDRLQGQFDQMLGMYQREAKLDALNTIAVFRSVFPDEWVVSPGNSPTSPRIIIEADGKMGVRGVLDRGQIQVVHPQQTQDARMAMDGLERAQRLTAGIPQELGGESGSNIRTASRGSSLLSSAIDMPLQEYQEILAASMELENMRAVKIMRSYYGSKPSMFFMGSDGKVVSDDYTPNETFDTNLSYVKYSLPGSDANAMSVRIGQKLGMGLISNETARTLDPDIEDALREGDLVELDGLRKSLLTGLEQQASQGQLDPSIIARIAVLKRSHMSIEDAVVEVHKQMQAAQQSQADAMQQQQQQDSSQQQAQQPGMGISPDNPAQGQQAPPGKPSLQDLLAQLHGGAPGGAPQTGNVAVQQNAVSQAPATAPPGV